MSFDEAVLIKALQLLGIGAELGSGVVQLSSASPD